MCVSSVCTCVVVCVHTRRACVRARACGKGVLNEGTCVRSYINYIASMQSRICICIAMTTK